jgi:Tfp pilus assembly protein PilO
MISSLIPAILSFIIGGVIAGFITYEYYKSENSKLHDKLDEKDIANNKLKKFATDQAEKVFNLNCWIKELEELDKEYSELEEINKDQVNKVIELGSILNEKNQIISEFADHNFININETTNSEKLLNELMYGSN